MNIITSAITSCCCMRNKETSKDSVEECCICLENIIHPAYLICGHEYCASCIKEWYSKNRSCPMCRAKSKIYTPYIWSGWLCYKTSEITLIFSG